MTGKTRNSRGPTVDMPNNDDPPKASSSRSISPSSSASSPHASSSSFNTTPARSPSPPHARRRKVAIIGSGLTGLSAAYYLCTSPDADSLEVHLFERASKIGLDSNSISIGDAPPTRIDVPMRSLNEGYYPNVMRLYRTLGIPLKKSDFTYSFAAFKNGQRAPTTTLLYEGASGARGFGMPLSCRGVGDLPTAMEFVSSPVGSTWTTVKKTSMWLENLFKYLSGVAVFVIGYLHLLVVSLWYHHTSATRSFTHRISQHTLRSYYSTSSQKTFLHDVVVPLFSAMMTVQASSVLDCPVADVFDYVALTFARSHYTVAEGVQEVERRISEPLDKHNVHVDCFVASLRRTDDGRIDVITNDENFCGFDDVILATQANQSASFVQSYLDSMRGEGAADSLREMHDRLKMFKYEDSQVVNHTDRSILPQDEKDWRDLNLVSPGGSAIVEKPFSKSTSTLSRNTHTMASHIILRRDSDDNHYDNDCPSLVIQTTNPLASLHPNPSTILSTSNFERAVLTLQGKQAQEGLFEWRRGQVELGRLQGQAGIWTCGSWSPGIPLLEGCVVSARLVVHALLQGAQIVEK